MTLFLHKKINKTRKATVIPFSITIAFLLGEFFTASFLEVSRLVEAEWELCYTKKLNRFIKKATLKYPSANLDDTIYDMERQLNS